MTHELIEWKRLWFLAGTALPNGYLPEDPSSYNLLGQPLSELEASPCLVLLGLPGMGKTTEMALAIRRAQERGEKVHLVDLGRVQTLQQLSDELAESSSGIHSLFLDGLDEALSRLVQLETLIPELLRSLFNSKNGLQNVRLRISCRSAEWSPALEVQLRSLWPDAFKKYELGTLRESDVADACRQLFLDHELFRSLVEDYNAEPLASRPVTLNMLLNLFAKNGDFPKEHAELYRKGLLATIEERGRPRRLKSSRLDSNSKLLVAARIAAACVFSGASQVWLGLLTEVQPDNTIALHELSGGTEPRLGVDLPISDPDLREALLTALFVPLQTDTFGWAHQTFAEFLAAYYLVEHKVDARNAISFLSQSSENKPIPPQLVEVSAWLASMDAAFFRELVGRQPQILLRSDVASASAEDRRRFVEVFLQKLDDGTLNDFDYGLRSRYSRFSHPELPSQLDRIIDDPQRGIIARRVAIDLAEANAVIELENRLLKVAFDVSDNAHIRAQAVAALSKIGSETARRELRPLAIRENINDPDDEVKGWALRAVWPNYITLLEVLKAMTPARNRSLIGAYWAFVSQLEIPALAADEAIASLDWVQEMDSTLAEDRILERLLPRLLRRVWEISNNEAVMDRLANFILYINDSSRLYRLQEMFSGVLSRADVGTALRRLMLKLLEKTPEQAPSIILLRSPFILLEPTDIPWLLEKYRSRTIREAAAVQLIVNLSFKKPLDELADLFFQADEFPVLKEALAQAYSLSTVGPYAKHLKEEYRRKAERPPETEEGLVKRIELAIQKVEIGDVWDWWQLNLQFFVSADGSWESHGEFQADLTKTRAWSLLRAELRARVVSLAFRYLSERRANTSRWLGTNTFYRPAAAAYRAFLLLHSEKPESLSQLPPRSWSNWASSLFGLSFNDEGDAAARRQLIAICNSMAQKQVVRIFKRLVNRASSKFSVREISSYFGPIWENEFSEIIWEKLRSLLGDEERESALMDVLVERKFLPAICSLEAKLNGSDDPPHLYEASLASALATYIEVSPNQAWDFFVSQWDRRPTLAVEVLNKLVEHGRDSEPFYRNLSETSAADFYLWSFQVSPPPDDDVIGEAKWMGARDFVHQLRSGVLNDLVNRGSAESVAAVRRIAGALPQLDWLKWEVASAEEAQSAAGWKRVRPSEVITIIASVSRLYISNIQPDSTASANQGTGQRTAKVVNLDHLEDAVVISAAGLHSAPLAGRKRRILLVATEWLSAHGGISTFNRKLCVALSKLGNNVACLVIGPEKEEIADAAKYGITLLSSPSDLTMDGLNRLLLVQPADLKGFVPEVVIGHDHITGAAAYYIAQKTNAKYVHFVHTIPENIERFKERHEDPYTRGYTKSKAQLFQCQRSDLVVCVGPKIMRNVEGKVIAARSNVPVFEIRPGLDDLPPTRPRNFAKIQPNCLFFGRMEDSALKGAELALGAFVMVEKAWPAPPRPVIVVRGFSEDWEVRKMPGFDAAKDVLEAKPFSSDESEIAIDLNTSCLVLMPSKSEGFGLTALEAISAGVPILITQESGLADLLLNDPEIAGRVDRIAVDRVIGAPVHHSDARDKWADRIREILRDPSTSFSHALTLRNALAPVLSWEKTAESLIKEFDVQIP